MRCFVFDEKPTKEKQKIINVKKRFLDRVFIKIFLALFFIKERCR
jgi:hypothetical protein